MTHSNNGAIAPALPACLNKRKAGPLATNSIPQSRSLSRPIRDLTHRQRLALQTLLAATEVVTVKDLVAVTKANNAPELIATLRRRGLEIPCRSIAFITAGGSSGKYGGYELADSDKPKALQLLGTAQL